MNICILGCGLQGRIVAQDLGSLGHRVIVLDINPENLKKVEKFKNIKTLQFDVKDRTRLVKFIKFFDVVVGALPAAFGFYSLKCAIAAKIDMVDMSYLSEEPFLLDREAKKSRVRIIPDAGFAPGLSNILIGEACRAFKKIDSLRVLVGGIPQKPVPPFNYRITWSPIDLIEEYTRPARIVSNFKVITKEALSGVEELNVPKIGRLECFYTDGLRTLLKTLRFVRDMEEKTIRYPGHARLFKALIDCGFLSDESVQFKGGSLKPKDFTLEFLKKFLNRGDEKDLSIMIIEIKGKGRKRRYTCIDYYDEKNKITSMARMTGYSCSIITQCIKIYPDFGIIPPEYLGMNKNICEFVKNELKKRRIVMKKSQ